MSASLVHLVAQLQTAAAAGATVPKNWGWVLALIAGGTLVVFIFLFWFYKKVQDSGFVEKLLGLPVAVGPRKQGDASPEMTPRATPSRGAFRFADEFLARRAEFWLLYAQAFVATFFIAVIAALMLVRVVTIDAGLPALSTVVGIILGKTLLSPKGTPLAGQEQGPPTAGPTNTKRPTAVGPTGTALAPTVTLTADPGEWSGQLPITYSYKWRRKDASRETEIAGETKPTYALADADKSHSVAVAVTATNSEGSTTVLSEYLAIP